MERSPAPSVQVARAAYQASVERLRTQYQALPVEAPVRLAKRTSNLFRMRDPNSTAGLDVSAFSGVLEVDPVARTADVLGMTTYENLVDATLRFGLMPMVVPELKTITLGGAVTGLGIESTSFRNGCPHESVLDFDVLTGDGRVITVTRDGPHADLFTGFPNSYGTLGYALRLRIELEPVKPFVALEHYPHHTNVDAAATIEDIARTGEHRGRRVDFLDGVVFSRDRVIVTVGRFVDEAPYLSDYTRSKVYYRSL
ncbi:MAG: FAD-binding oxidoreductase, partial [Actinomycetes bacterium]